MSEILCHMCWNQSINRYGRLCSIQGIIEPNKIECERFVMECPNCARKCTKIKNGWFCLHCGWSNVGIKGKCAEVKK